MQLIFIAYILVGLTHALQGVGLRPPLCHFRCGFLGHVGFSFLKMVGVTPSKKGEVGREYSYTRSIP